MNRLCGPLDVGDGRALIPTGHLLPAELIVSGRAALASPAFDGTDQPFHGRDAMIEGHRTVIKLQRRGHERLETVLRFEERRRHAGIRAPRLLDHGAVNTSAGEIWWAVLERVTGTQSEAPSPAQQRILGAQLRRWHESGPAGGLRMDDPGGLGVLLGSARFVVPRVYPRIAALFDTACRGRPVTAIHGDVALGHNMLFEGDELIAIIDPGAVEIGPPMLDLAWALAVDLPRGGSVGPLLEGYGRDAVDQDALDAVLPLMVLRRYIDTFISGARHDTKWLTGWLEDNAPHLLELVATELDLRS